ncbi:VRR-NUC domain-containing protein [Salinisphaera sp. T31B1]|uniref:VRR-NUC domain-containing protein n=1 Tax=Salinisphaera sp. T31B1 TaxID=727963 RepID=UPI0033411EDD
MSEHTEQATLIRMVDWNARQHPELSMLYAVPNGSDRHPAVAGKLKAEGVRKGVPDLCLPVARQGYHGLYVEMKTTKGRTSPEQRDWIERLQGEGYRAAVCRGWSAAWNEIAGYLGIKEETKP